MRAAPYYRERRMRSSEGPRGLEGARGLGAGEARDTSDERAVRGGDERTDRVRFFAAVDERDLEAIAIDVSRELKDRPGQAMELGAAHARMKEDDLRLRLRHEILRSIALGGE